MITNTGLMGDSASSAAWCITCSGCSYCRCRRCIGYPSAATGAMLRRSGGLFGKSPHGLSSPGRVCHALGIRALADKLMGYTAGRSCGGARVLLLSAVWSLAGWTPLQLRGSRAGRTPVLLPREHMCDERNQHDNAYFRHDSPDMLRTEQSL